MLSSRPFTFDRVVRLVITALFIIAVFWLLKVLYDALLPFFIACLLAYIFEPFVAFNKRLLHCRNNIIPIILFIIEFTACIGLLGYLLVPMIVDELIVAANLIKEYATSEATPILPDSIHDLIREYIDVTALSSLLTKEQWLQLIQKTLSGTWTVVSGSISAIFTFFGWFIVLLYFIFILLDYNRFMNGVRNLVPQKYKPVVFSIAHDIKISMNHYFRGQTLVALIVAVLFCIAFLIIKMPMAILLGMLIGVLSLVPYLKLISLLPAALLCLLYVAETGSPFWPMALQTTIIYIVIQAIEDMYLVPRIMGKTMGLNPAIILLSLSVWGTLLGFMGLIIALPLTTLLLSYYNRYVIAPGIQPDTVAGKDFHEDRQKEE